MTLLLRHLTPAAVLLACLPVASVAHADLLPDVFPPDGVTCDLPSNGGVGPGSALKKVTLDDLPAPPLCNDGTPGVMFVRPGTGGGGSGSSDSWVIHLQGGRQCGDYDSCRARWCGNDPLFDAGKMSSAYVSAAVVDNGIFKADPQNPFGGWNHVFLYYCSSDLWIGDQPGMTTLTNGTDPFDIYFQGSAILGEAIRVLQAGATTDDGSFTLPSLNDGSRVILSGDSAASTGARNNADRVRGWILDQHNDPPSLDFRLVGDAAMVQALERDGVAAWESVVLPIWNDTWVGIWNGRPDASCVSFHGGVAGADVWRCADPNHVVVHHVEVPFFIRQDLTDPVKEKTTPEEFFGDVSQQLLSFANYPAISPPYATPAEEPSALGPMRGGFGPNCGQHIGILNDPGFFVHTIDDGTGNPLNFARVLSNWIAGSGVTLLVEDVQRDSMGTPLSVDASTCQVAPQDVPIGPVGTVALAGLLALIGLAVIAWRGGPGR